MPGLIIPGLSRVKISCSVFTCSHVPRHVAVLVCGHFGRNSSSRGGVILITTSRAMLATARPSCYYSVSVRNPTATKTRVVVKSGLPSH